MGLGQNMAIEQQGQSQQVQATQPQAQGGNSGSGLIGGIIAGVADLALGDRNANRQWKREKEAMGLQMQNQKDLNKFNQELQLDTWNKTNFEAQRKHLENAGMSVGLMYGQGGAGGATTGSAGGSASGGHAPTQQATNTMQAIGMGLQMELLKAQKDNIEANTLKTKTEAAKTAGIDTSLGNKQLDILTQEEQIKNLQRQLDNDTLESKVSLQKLIEAGQKTENELKAKNIQVADGQINKMIQDIAQGWKHLNNEERQTKVQEFKAELEAKYPTIDKVAGGQLNNLIQTLNEIIEIPTKSDKIN